MDQLEGPIQVAVTEFAGLFFLGLLGFVMSFLML